MEENRDVSVIRLEIGGGVNKRLGFINCDIRDIPSVDVQCKAHELPFEDNSVDQIYSRHLIEHFTLNEFLKVLQEWNRALKINGEIYIICPNLIYHLNQIINSKHNSIYSKERNNNDRYWAFGSLFGWQQDEFDFHKFGYYFELIKDILLEFNFDEIENLTSMERSLENSPWHLEVRGKKRGSSIKHESSILFNHFEVTH